MDIQTHALWLGTLAVVNVPVYILLGCAIFGSWGGFFEALKYRLMPDLFSAVRGELFEDWWAEAKLGIFALLCIGTVAAEYAGLLKLFGRI